jgi:hypothetical protein
MKTGVLFLLFALLAIDPVNAEGRKIFIRGGGRAVCSEWLAVRNQNIPERLLAHQWVLGYVTSYNVNNLSRSADVANAMASAAIFEAIDAWCRDHPADTVEKTLGVLIETWKRQFDAR